MHPLMAIIVVLVVCQIVLLASAIYHTHMLHTRVSAVSGSYWWKIGPLIGASIMLSLLILWIIGLLPWIGV